MCCITKTWWSFTSIWKVSVIRIPNHCNLMTLRSQMVWFSEFWHNVLKEQQLVKKLEREYCIFNMEHTVTIEFEQGRVKRGFHLILNEILEVMSQVWCDSNAHRLIYLPYIEVSTMLCNITMCSLYYIY